MARADESEVWGDEMPKTGQRLPWKVEYLWDSGVRGKSAHHDQEDAERNAQEIRTAAERQGRTVTVEVYRVEAQR